MTAIGDRYPSDSDTGAKNLVDLTQWIRQKLDEIDLSSVDSRIATAVQQCKNDILDGVATEYDTLKELAAAIGDNRDLITALGELGSSHVSFTTAQSLSDAQKTQARANIGAADASTALTKSEAQTTYLGKTAKAASATTADSADTATNATHATSADSATTATNASHATTADSATSADHATTADSATSATNAVSATSAESATNDADGNAIASTYLKTADQGVLIVPESIVTVTKESTKGTSPFNTSYGYTNITVNLPKALLKEGLVIFPAIASTMVVASANRNVRIRFGEDDAWHPVMGSTSIISGYSYFTSSNFRGYVYRTHTRPEGAFHLLSDSNTTYSTYSLGIGYGTCATAEATVAKVVSLASYALVTGGIVAVKFTNAVPASATMNVNSKGAKAIKWHGEAITAGVIGAGDLATFIYDGSAYQLLAIDKEYLKATDVSCEAGADIATAGTPSVDYSNGTFTFHQLKGATGEQGVTGPRGYYFTPSVSAEGVLSWTNNGGLVNPESVTIKGEKGDKGDAGDPATTDFGQWEES